MKLHNDKFNETYKKNNIESHYSGFFSLLTSAQYPNQYQVDIVVSEYVIFVEQLNIFITETPPSFPEDEDKEEIDEKHLEILDAWQKKLHRF